MKFFKNIRSFFLFTILLLLVSACSNGEPAKETFKYDFSRQFKITTMPLGHKRDNLAFVLQLPKEENGDTKLSVSTFEVYRNGNLILKNENFSETIRYNSWQNSEGITDSNYQAIFYCLPENYTESLNLNDEIKVIFKCESDRKITNTVKTWLIDNSEDADLWITVGTEINNTNTDSETPDSSESKINYIYDYSYNYIYKIKTLPTGSKKENVVLAFQQHCSEGAETQYQITELKVYQNGTLIKDSSGETSRIWFNQWTNSDGTTDANFMTMFYLLPENFSGGINKNDKIKIQLKFKASRELKNPLIPYLIDSSKAADYWLVLGDQTFEYAATPVPDESITYNGQNYKLVFNDDFDKDFSEKNPLKNGLYKQAFDMNNWWTEDWGAYSNTSNGYEHRSIKNFKIHDGVAEFPMVIETKYNGDQGVRCNAGPTLITSVWDPKGVNSVPIYEFNKGIFEIKFMGPEGTNHPGQFTFWVLNYTTDFEAPATNGKIPTNPNKASDGYALDEIDFFEYSPSYNGTGCIRMGTRSSNGINSRPAAGYGKKTLDSSFGGKWHVFRCIWDDSGLTAYLDGEFMSSVSASSIKGFDNPNDKFMLIVTAQSIKESGIDGNVDSEFDPYSYFVDYIKVYEKE